MPTDPALPQPFTREMASQVGLTRHCVEHRIRRGDWHRLRHGVYCLRSVWEAADDRGRHLLRAQAELWLREQHLVLSHESAAARNGWPTPQGGLGRVWLTSGRLQDTPRRTAGAVLEVATLRPQDTCVRDQVRQTSDARTVIDCLRHMQLADAVAIADSALHRGAVGLDELAAVLTWQEGWPYAARAHAALLLVDARRETYLESTSFVGLWQHGVRLPTPQVWVYDACGRFVARVDGMWLPEGVVGEADGRSKYELDALGRADPAGMRRQLLREKTRHDDVSNTGLQVVRWGTTHIQHDLPGLAARIRAMLARSDLSRFTGSLRTSANPRDTIDLTAYR